ncbi:sodium-dependent phosphate transporter [Desulfuribacillus stibiiarsenatis]|uniref:Sodium-dependent phosphate transporter n=1 Tax=Desulfuribacillus stibiiarsenatis TaxID=1390249 RepID=A0A1E5L2X0_9FIRM|nr:Na/Pi cotransporter family protein [Desulfuribacillus stibiiarsenatis]OEH84447.1 sodium-dependent phosphate transporter [Desulfuribacillus stibiiarsenatis]
MDISWQDLIFSFFGGLGVFLFGLHYMSDGLQKTAGEKLRKLLEKMTTNPVMGVIAGALITGIIQSSTGTTVMAVGFVNAGLMTLRQAIGVIMGANIGTTVTAFLIGFKISKYALPMIGVGMVLLFFTKKKRINYFGQVIFGAGMLFLGLNLMSDSMKPLRSWQVFQDLMVTLGDVKILGVLVGAVFTAVVQSSTATIGVLQELAYQGGVTFHQALPILFGENIGTTITAALAAIGASISARRAALTHFIFNAFGTIIFLLLIGWFEPLVIWIASHTGADIKLQIAYAHGIFNVSNTLIFLPLTGLLAAVVTKMIPGNDVEIEFGTKHLNPHFLSTPNVALGQVVNELTRMGNYAREAYNDASEYFFEGNHKRASIAMQKEALVNELDKKITEYMIQLSQNSLSEKDSNQHNILFQTINDIERIGDHAENILELGDYKMDKKIVFSDEGYNDLKTMVAAVDESIRMAIEALEKNDKELARKVMENEKQIDMYERMFRKAHIQRLNNGVCTGNAGIVYLDTLSNLERIGDHAYNIARSVLGEY